MLKMDSNQTFLACSILEAADRYRLARRSRRVQGLPPQQPPTTLRPQRQSIALTAEVWNLVRLDSMTPHLSRDLGKVLLEVEIKTPSHRGLYETVPADPYNTLGSVRSDQHLPPPSEPTHHQVVIGSQMWRA